MKFTVLLLPGFIFTAFPTAHRPNLFTSIGNVSVSLSFMIFLYIIQSSAKCLIVDPKFLQIFLSTRGTEVGLIGSLAAPLRLLL